MSNDTATNSAAPCPQGTLFDCPEPVATATEPVVGPPRLLQAQRDQLLLLPVNLEELIPEDHPARVVWDYVQGLDLGPLYQRIRSLPNRPGRPAIDPKILLALWLYATVDGVGSARKLDDLCARHDAYKWLRGGVAVNYHTLSDFRTDHPEFLDDLLTKSVALLLHEGLIDATRVAQDGMRVRASAGTASFRRGPRLEEHLQQAEEHVRRLKTELEADPGQAQRRSRKAQERAARERAERIRRALEQLPDVEAKKKADEKAKARVSTTDSEARVMKMGDGGFRPAYNFQYATDTSGQVIMGVDVTNSGSDQGQMAPMVEQLQDRQGVAPKEMLVDGGFATKEDIERVSAPAVGTTVYAPVQQPRNPDRDPHTPRPGDQPAVVEWRQRMATPEAKEIYKERAATAECVNAIARNRGLQQLRVRGLAKVKAIALWFALAHNVMRTVTLRAVASAGPAVA
jgi:transposase